MNLRSSVIGLVVLGLSAQVEAAPTAKCNTGYSSQIWLYQMSQQTQSRLVDAVANPGSDPDLYQRLWAPLKASSSTSVLSNRSVILTMDPFQDLPEMMSAMRADPVIATMVSDIADNGGVCFATSPPPTFQRVTEYHNTVLDHYFLSSSPEENAIIDAGGAGPGWVRTGESFLTISPDYCSQSDRVFRFYGPGPNSHFFTADPSECGGLRKTASGWIGEGVAFGARVPVNGACPSSAYTPVYRAYNNRWMFNDSNHRYAIRTDVYRQMVDRGWIGEGVALCVRDGR
jgi:hypothetical protein